MTATQSETVHVDSRAATPDTGCVQLALNVDNIAEAITFSNARLGTPPAQVRRCYANFAGAAPPLKLVPLEYPGKGAPSTTSASRSHHRQGAQRDRPPVRPGARAVGGPGCHSCKTLERVAREAVAELGVEATIEDYPTIVGTA